MKILILADHFAVGGGAGEIARIQAEELSRDHEVTVLTAHAPKDQGDKFKFHTYNLDYHPSLRTYLGIRHPKAVKVLKNFLQRRRPDICHVHNLNVNWSYYSLKILREAGIKTVLYFHDVTAVTPYVKLCGMKHARDYRYPWWRELRAAKFSYNPLRHYLVRKYMSMASERVAVSQALADFLRTNGIPVDRVERNKLPLLEETPSDMYDDSIFLGGRLSSSKGALEAVRYLAILKEKYKLEVKLRLAAAEGIVTRKMQVFARELGVEDQLEFLGWLDKKELQKAMRNCGAVIVPSICFDSLPTIILEAMRQAKPVVATIYGGSRELVEDGKTGFIRDPRDIGSFSDAIARILQDKKLAAVFGQAGQERFRNHFTL